jgi:hypothetical protein
MKNKHEDCYKGFIQLNKAWYGNVNLKGMDYIDEVSFGFYHPDGGTSGEMSMKWYQFGGDKKPSAKLCVFYDAFDSLYQFKDVIDELRNYDNIPISPEEFCDVLLKCGFVDRTPITQ